MSARPQIELHGLVLAGGLSSRMGRAKALLPLPPDGRPLLAVLAGRLQTLCPGGVIVSLGAEEAPAPDSTGSAYSLPAELARAAAESNAGARCRWVTDEPRFARRGPLAGLHAGLSALPHDDAWAFALACDMPALSPALLARFTAAAAAGQAAGLEAVLCPGEPFHALYRRTAAGKAEAALASGRARLMEWVGTLHAAYIEPAPEEQAAFLNLNTPEEYRRYIENGAH